MSIPPDKSRLPGPRLKLSGVQRPLLSSHMLHDDYGDDDEQSNKTAFFQIIWGENVF